MKDSTARRSFAIINDCLAARKCGLVLVIGPDGYGASRAVNLNNNSGAVADSGEARWTINVAMEQGEPAPVLTSALFARFCSNQSNTYGEYLLSGMRFDFGGHLEIRH